MVVLHPFFNLVKTFFNFDNIDLVCFSDISMNCSISFVFDSLGSSVSYFRAEFFYQLGFPGTDRY